MNNSDLPMNNQRMVDEALKQWLGIAPGEMSHMGRRPAEATLDSYLVDDDFDSDIRVMLCDMLDEGFDLTTFLLACDSDRHLDLIRCYERLKLAARVDRGEFSRLRMRYSLCPLHGIDWAICFNDQDEECRAIRVCFPNEYDT